MKVEFANNNELLGKILYALAHSDTDPEIKSIDYSWGEVEIESRLGSGFYMDRGKELLADHAGYDLDIEPDDIEMKDTVTATWDLID